MKTNQNADRRTPRFRSRSALPILPLLLCLPLWLGLAVVWVRSYWVADSFWWNRHNQVRAVVLSTGGLEIYIQRIAPDAPFSVSADRGHRAQAPSRPDPSRSGLVTAWEHAGFGYAAGADPFGHRRIIVAPLWALAPVVGFSPMCLAALLRRRRRARRRSENRCAFCGYSLTGNLSGTCPECGAEVHESPNATAAA